jgi:hypothetical protein
MRALITRPRRGQKSGCDDRPEGEVLGEFGSVDGEAVVFWSRRTAPAPDAEVGFWKLDVSFEVGNETGVRSISTLRGPQRNVRRGSPTILTGGFTSTVGTGRRVGR